MHALIATDSVHTTAAACDYLEPRLGSSDTVTVVSVSGPDARDAADALNVANARLLGYANVETKRIHAGGDPTPAIVSAIDDYTPDIVLIGPHAGDPGAGPSLGRTTQQLVESVDIPTVVVPLSG